MSGFCFGIAFNLSLVSLWHPFGLLLASLRSPFCNPLVSFGLPLVSFGTTPLISLSCPFFVSLWSPLVHLWSPLVSLWHPFGLPFGLPLTSLLASLLVSVGIPFVSSGIPLVSFSVWSSDEWRSGVSRAACPNSEYVHEDSMCRAPRRAR